MFCCHFSKAESVNESIWDWTLAANSNPVGVGAGVIEATTLDALDHVSLCRYDSKYLNLRLDSIVILLTKEGSCAAISGLRSIQR